MAQHWNKLAAESRAQRPLAKNVSHLFSDKKWIVVFRVMTAHSKTDRVLPVPAFHDDLHFTTLRRLTLIWKSLLTTVRWSSKNNELSLYADIMTVFALFGGLNEFCNYNCLEKKVKFWSARQTQNLSFQCFSKEAESTSQSRRWLLFVDDCESIELFAMMF